MKEKKMTPAEIGERIERLSARLNEAIDDYRFAVLDYANADTDEDLKSCAADVRRADQRVERARWAIERLSRQIKKG